MVLLAVEVEAIGEGYNESERVSGALLEGESEAERREKEAQGREEGQRWEGNETNLLV